MIDSFFKTRGVFEHFSHHLVMKKKGLSQMKQPFYANVVNFIKRYYLFTILLFFAFAHYL